MFNTLRNNLTKQKWGVTPHIKEPHDTLESFIPEDKYELMDVEPVFDIRQRWLEDTMQKIYLQKLFKRWKAKVIHFTENFTTQQQIKVRKQSLKKFFWVWKVITRPPGNQQIKKSGRFYDKSRDINCWGQLAESRLTSAGAWVIEKDFPGVWSVSAGICDPKGMSKNRTGKCPKCNHHVYSEDVRNVLYFPCGHTVHRACCFEKQKGLLMHVCRDFTTYLSPMDGRSICAGVPLQNQNVLLEKCPMMVLDRSFLLIGPLGYYWRITPEKVYPGTRFISVSDYAKNRNPDGHIWGAIRAATKWRRKSLFSNEVRKWGMSVITIRFIANAWNDIASEFNRFVNGVMKFRGQKFIAPRTYQRIESQIHGINKNMQKLSVVMEKQDSFQNFMEVWEALSDQIHNHGESLSEMFPPVKEYRNGILLHLKERAYKFERAFEQALINIHNLMEHIQRRFENDRCCFINGRHSLPLWSITFQQAHFTYSLPPEDQIFIQWIMNYRKKYSIKACDERVNMQWTNQSLFWSNKQELIFVLPQICLADLTNHVYRIQMAHIEMEDIVQKMTEETKIPYTKWNEDNRKK